jgi:hypothetical protein
LGGCIKILVLMLIVAARVSLLFGLPGLGVPMHGHQRHIVLNWKFGAACRTNYLVPFVIEVGGTFWAGHKVNQLVEHSVSRYIVGVWARVQNWRR